LLSGFSAFFWGVGRTASFLLQRFFAHETTCPGPIELANIQRARRTNCKDGDGGGEGMQVWTRGVRCTWRQIMHVPSDHARGVRRCTIAKATARYGREHTHTWEGTHPHVLRDTATHFPKMPTKCVRTAAVSAADGYSSSTRHSDLLYDGPSNLAWNCTVWRKEQHGLQQRLSPTELGVVGKFQFTAKKARRRAARCALTHF
jgi:hypothetical protein